MEIIFKFEAGISVENWVVVNDVVMGGKSSGHFSLTPEGFGLFKGEISLENNGGFSSVKYQLEPLKVHVDAILKIKLKGDGSSYQLRIKDDSNNKHSYITVFHTTGAWQELDIPLKTLYPQFRGEKLNAPNFSGEYMEQIGFLLANKKAENFNLLIDTIGIY